MRISIIVAVYNIEAYIAHCIESLCSQTYRNLEIILVVDGATDSSGKICEEYAKKDDRIQVVYRENGGLSAARNTGIEKATGEYITFVDGDDWVEETMYETMAELAGKYNADLVACRYKCIYRDSVKDGSTGKVTVYTRPYEMLLQYLKEDEAYLIQHAAWNKLYKRELLGEERFPEGEWYEDVVFSAHILSRVHTGVYVDTAFYNYVCEREGSIMNAGLTERVFTDRIPAYLKKEAFLETLPDKEAVSLHRYYFYKRLLIFYEELWKKENKPLKKHQKELKQLLRERKNTFPDVFGVSIAKKTDILKLKIFSASPLLFHAVMWVNEKWILPRKLGTGGKK